MNTMKTFSGKYGMVLLAMCGFACSSYGIAINSAGVFFTPIAEEFLVGKGAVSLTITISSIVTALAGLLLPKILKEKSMKTVFLTAAACMILASIGMGLSPNIYVLYLMNALRGFGGGLISFVTITIFINNWFYAKHGLATSITMGFSGISGALLSPLFTLLIQQIGWRATYFASAVLLAVFCLPSLVLPFSLKPETVGMHAFGLEERVNTEKGTTASETASSGSLAFLWICIVATGSNIIIGIVQHLPSYAQSLQFSAAAGALMLSLALIGNIGSKLIAGTLADAIGTKNSLLIIASLHVLSVILLFCTGNLLFLYLGSLLMGCGYGMGAVGITLMTKSLFGVEGFIRVFPIVSFIGTIAYALATTGIGYLYDLTSSYMLSLEICLILSILVVLAIALAYRIKKQ